MIAMFGMVMAYGVSILGNINFNNQNNLLIIAVSVGLGTGISAVPKRSKLRRSIRLVNSKWNCIGCYFGNYLKFLFNGINYKQSDENVK